MPMVVRPTRRDTTCHFSATFEGKDAEARGLTPFAGVRSDGRRRAELQRGAYRQQKDLQSIRHGDMLHRICRAVVPHVRTMHRDAARDVVGPRKTVARWLARLLHTLSING